MTGTILAGGRSRRMGEDKAFLTVGGRRIIDRTLNMFSSIFSSVLVVTNTPARYADLGVRLAGDMWPGTGVLGGLYTALFWAPTPKIFVVACDMPLLSRAVIHLLIERSERWDVVVPKINDEFEPLHAVYSRRCMKAIEETLVGGSRRIVDFYSRVRVLDIPEKEIRAVDPRLQSFRNVNTPEDLEEIRRLVDAE